MNKKEQKQIDKIVNELWAVMRSHHVPTIVILKAMRDFYEPMKTLEYAIMYEK